MLDMLDKIIIKRLQEGMPITEEPYRIISEELKIEEKELLRKIIALKENGILKRLGAVLYHREAGFKANALVAWRVAEDEVEYIGKELALMPEISHCYERDACKEWNYNLYTMIHGKNKIECEKIINKISKNIDLHNYKVLYSVRELKKSSMKYFE